MHTPQEDTLSSKQCLQYSQKANPLGLLCMASIFLPPFPSKDQLRSHLEALDCMLQVQAAGIDDQQPLSPAAVNAFLQLELETPILNELYPYLWLVAKKSGDHIDA